MMTSQSENAVYAGAAVSPVVQAHARLDHDRRRDCDPGDHPGSQPAGGTGLRCTAAEFAGMPAADRSPKMPGSRPGHRATGPAGPNGDGGDDEPASGLHAFSRAHRRCADLIDARHMIVTVEDITAEVQRRSEGGSHRRRTPSHRPRDPRRGGAALPVCASSPRRGAIWRMSAGMRSALGECRPFSMPRRRPETRDLCAASGGSRRVAGFYPALAQLVRDFGDHNQLAARLEDSWPAGSIAGGR